jgi:type II restriction/modification system DNA methylase subunit YeeA
MNRNKTKAYAPQARRDFIRAVTDRAALYGLTKEKTEPVVVRGDVAVIGGRPYPRFVAALRKRLQERIGHEGFDHVMEAMAYTWFNRLVAIRYMELHEYLDHGFRVLSHPEGRNTPQILEHAEEVDLPGLKRETVIDLKLAGNREAELYRKLLIAQCNALHDAMPFLFERIDDETELLLPDNLLQTDSIVRTLVAGIDEEDWQRVEIIGWIYQFYISERKDEVIGKVVASEDIPAATQLFTPNWIVKYLVQNTLGRLWLETHPESPLKRHMEYYIEPAPQTPEVQAQLRTITPMSLNPEDLTLLDPACGSGHILIEAYDLFKAIYQERGYRARDIPAQILTKNLFGLEIDDRAAQLAAFALMMKARGDDRRLFDQKVQPQVMALVQTDDMDAEDIAAALNIRVSNETRPPGALFETEDNLFTRAASAVASSQNNSLSDVKTLVDMFEHAKTFGSLIQVPPELSSRLPQIERSFREVAKETSQIASRTAARFLPVIKQARLLFARYACVVANPPYMGRRNGMNRELKDFGNERYPESSADLYTMFIERGFQFTYRPGFTAMVAMHSWLFLPTFQSMREAALKRLTFDSLAHLGPRAFSSISGEVVQVAAFSMRSFHLDDYHPVFLQLTDGDEGTKAQNLIGRKNAYENVRQSDFIRIPGNPVAYWASESTRLAFEHGKPLKDLASPRSGLGTTNNDKFLRLWFEVPHNRIFFSAGNREEAKNSKAKWFPYNKGGPYRKWYGNNDYIVNWFNDGCEIKDDIKDKNPNVARGESYYFKPSITWTDIGASRFGVRQSDKGFIFDTSGSSAFPEPGQTTLFAGFLCSSVSLHFLTILNPTMHFQVGNVGNLPVVFLDDSTLARRVDNLAREAISLSRADWDRSETSWDYRRSPLLDEPYRVEVLADSANAWWRDCEAQIHRLKAIETENNLLFIDAYNLADELSPEVPLDQITLYRPNREEESKRLISYAIGCMMGRFSLDEPGLIYAESCNIGFDLSRYKTFPADHDGIVPLTEIAWFADDATNRFVEFLGVTWPKEHLDENLKFVAESLGPNRGEPLRDTIRRYLATGFFKHHRQTYKRRPIYWLFSSGKQRAFQCLVYLHRYHEGTLSRMRTEYVIPLQGMIASRIEHLAGEISAATSTAQRKKLEKEREVLLKQQAELHAFDEKLRHFAEKQITLDLDDGVKVNYGKFGDLLAEVKSVTGGGDNE